MALQRGRAVGEPEAGAEMLCVASRLELQRWRYLLPFIRLSNRVSKQLDEAPGLLRWAVLAEPWSKRFYTFTAWRDRSSLAAFVSTEPHAEAVRMMRVWGSPQSAFSEWSSTELPGRLSEIKDRLRQPTFYYKGGGTR